MCSSCGICGASKKRRKRHRHHDSRGFLAGKRHISERPPSVESRAHIGHREIDTVMGDPSKHCIVSLVERKTGFLQIGKLRARTAELTIDRTVKLIERHPDSSARLPPTTEPNSTATRKSSAQRA